MQATFCIESAIGSRSTSSDRVSSANAPTSQHTLDHKDCPACEEVRRAAMSPSELAELPFAQAAKIWLDSRKNINHGDHSTRFMYECYFRVLSAFFGDMKLKDVADAGPINAFIAERSKGGTIPNPKDKSGFYRPAGSSILRHEINALKQVLERAGLWNQVSEWVELPALKKSTRGRALSQEEEQRLFRMAGERSKWLVAYCCMIISANTTADPGEIRHLKLGDVEIDRRLFHIRDGLKNRFRARTVAMNDDCLWAMRTLYNRALEKGSIYPHHYLLPARASAGSAGFNPFKPQGDWRSAWETLRVHAGMPTLRLKDLRHHAITKLLENPNISERTVIEMAGHVSAAMLDTYSHQRLNAKFAAVEALSMGIHKSNEQLKPQLVASKK